MEPLICVILRTLMYPCAVILFRYVFLFRDKRDIRATIHLTDEQFRKRIADYSKSSGRFEFLGSRPAVVDFYAAWCGPCKMFSPVFEEVSGEYAGKVDFYKVNVEEEEKLASFFSVRSIPTLLFIPKNGKYRIVQGAIGKPQLKQAVDEILL